MRTCSATATLLILIASFARGEIYQQREDVIFAQMHGVAVTMDIFTPVGEKNGLGIVDIASGAWSSDRGKIRDHKRALIYDIFCKRGYTVFAIRPGSVSKFSGLEMKEHIEQGIRWIKARSDEFDIDPHRLGLTGASAGGHLASLVAVTNGKAKAETTAAVAAVGVFFPPTDLIEYGDKSLDPRGQDELSRIVRALAFRERSGDLTDDEVQQGLTSVSPARLVTSDTPPFLIFHGDADAVVPLQQSQRLLAELKKCDVPAELFIKKGGGHPWLTIPLEIAKLADWFDRQLIVEHTSTNAEGESVEARPLEIGNRLELFVDDLLIDKLTGDIATYLHRPEPKEVVLVTDAPWEGNTSAYYTVFRDEDRFRMYYRGSHYDEETNQPAHREVTCYAESQDGIHWTKPELGLFEFAGSKRNNIVLDGIGTHCFAAFRDDRPDCPPDAKYKGIARGRPLGKRGLYVFKSPDGIRWESLHPEPVITTGAFDSQNLAFWDPLAKHYREYHRTFVDGVRAIMTSTSQDYVHWGEPVLLRYPETQPEQLYTNAIQPYDRAPHLLIGFPTRYLPATQRVEPTLMCSRDGVTFNRWLDPVIPEDAPEDRGGNRSNYMAWGHVEIPGRPNHYSVYATEAYYTGPDSRLRRFEYRKDGFVSVRGGKDGGDLVTPAIKLGELAERLVINIATKPAGIVRVGLEDADRIPIPGYTLRDCIRLTGDQLRANVSWQDGADISTLKGRTVRLRVYLQDSDLYSIQFQPWLR